ncbi:MAG: hypothetical protein ABIR39_03560 [Nocardioides sp.]
MGQRDGGSRTGHVLDLRRNYAGMGRADFPEISFREAQLPE